MALNFAEYRESLGAAPSVADAVGIAAVLHVLIYEAFDNIDTTQADVDMATDAVRDPATRWALENRITGLLRRVSPDVLAEAIAANELTGEPDPRLSIDLGHPS